MSFDWTEYYHVAQEAITLSPTAQISLEARQRCAISRAYYAAFMRAQNHLRFVDGDTQIPTDYQIHGYVRWKFKRSHNRRRKQVADLLNNLRLVRNEADYEATIPNLTANTTLALQQAARVIAILNSL